MGAYIINVPDSVDRVVYINVDPMDGKTYIASYSVDNLTPYTEPDLHEVCKKAYEKGYHDAVEEKYNDGLADAWDAARKICTNWVLSDSVLSEIFGMDKTIDDIMKESTASEAIEKIRQYEQEKDRQARIEYNFDEIKDVLETTVKECNVSLDEIAEVLRKMKETDNG